MLMLAASVITLIWPSFGCTPGSATPTETLGTGLQIPATLGAAVARAVSIDSSFRVKQWMGGQLAWLVSVWFVGVVMLSVRTAGGWILVQALRRLGL
jgi:hypothetical protein